MDNRFLQVFASSSILILASYSFVDAQTGNVPAGPRGSTEALIPVRDDVLNRSIIDATGRSVGTIKELVVDKGGRVHYVLAGDAKAAAAGEWLVVPYSALRRADDGDYILELPPDKLASAPRLAKDTLAPLNDDRWNRMAYAYYGQIYPGTLMQSFAQLDANSDGILSREEARHDRNLHANFQAADDNRDGRIDQSEFSAFEVSMGVIPQPINSAPVQSPRDTPPAR